MARYPFLKRLLLGTLCGAVFVLVSAGFSMKGMPLNAEVFTAMVTEKILELDFSETDTVYYEFDNNAPGPFEFKEIEMNQPQDSEAHFVAEFLVDEDGDGVCESRAEGRGYTIEFESGTSSLAELPHGSALKKYCLRITNISAAAENARLSVSLHW